jgi:hypothetical protein
MKAEPLHLTQIEWVLDGITGQKFIRIEGRRYDYTLHPGRVDLVNDKGEVHNVTKLTCSCRDAQFRRRVHGCRHRVACRALGLLKRAAEMKHQPQEAQAS